MCITYRFSLAASLAGERLKPDEQIEMPCFEFSLDNRIDEAYWTADVCLLVLFRCPTFACYPERILLLLGNALPQN